MINSLDKINLKDKRAILQLDFDESFKSCRQTIEYLLKHKTSLIIIGSLEKEMSLMPWIDELEKITGRSVAFLDQSIFEKSFPDKVKNCLEQNQVVLLENLVIYPEEERGDSVLAQALSRLADIYVNEAFGTSYLSYASLTQLPDFLESAGGFDLLKEKNSIERLNDQAMTVVLGGDRVADTLRLLLMFLEKSEHILVSGKIAEAIFRVKGISPGRNWPDDQIVRLIKKINLADPKLHLPIDVVTGPKNLDDSYRRVFAPGEVRKEDDIYDIGPETIRLFKNIINHSKSLIWRGPLGLYAWPEFSRGTQAIAEAITQKTDLYSVVGGREIVGFLGKLNLLDKFSHVSNGGETMMRMAAGQKLPPFESLLSDNLIG